MNRLGLLRVALPTCAWGFVIAACGGGDSFEMAAPMDGGADAIDTPDAGGGSDVATVDAAPNEGGDATPTCPDVDKDGQTTCAGDCNDNDPGIYRGAPEICGDGKDNNCNMQVDEGCNGLGTYVSGIKGLDSNPGTQAMPVKTITKGIQNAVAIGGAQSVFVAQGHYPEKVTMVEGASLLGGYQCDPNGCTWARDPKAYDTAIDMQDGEGVLAGATITKKTRIDGFRLRGKPGSASGGSVVCLSLDGGSPTVTGNTFAPADVTGARAVGIEIYAPTVDPTGALIDGNVIQGGSSTTSWVGIFFDAKAFPPVGSSAAVVTNNKIRGGSAPNTVGLQIFTSGVGTLVQKNDILAGTAPSNGSAFAQSWAIAVASKATIDSNAINVDQNNVGTCTVTTMLCGGIASYSSTTTITNNIVFGVKGPLTAGILLSEAEGPPGPVVLNGNYIDGAGSGLAVNPTRSAALWLRICAGASCGVNSIIGKVRNNVLMGGMNSARYGVYEEQIANRTAHPQFFEFDDIFFAPQAGRTDALYHFWNGATATDLTTTAQIASTLVTNPPPNNLSNVDPLLDATLHLKTTPASPLIDKGTSTEAPAKDFEGDTRPKGPAVDIGHDEAQ
jgi:hypothetical protein